MSPKKGLLRYVVLIIAILLTVSGFAQNDETASPDTKRKLESWYHSFTVGYTLYTAVDGIQLETSMAVALDFLRFYFPVSKKMVIGPGVYGTGLTDTSGTMQLYLYLYSVSAQIYFNSIGDGMFLRADAGAARGLITDISGEAMGISDWGYGFLAGAGYALPISQETSLLFYAAYRDYTIQAERYNDVTIQVGWLW